MILPSIGGSSGSSGSAQGILVLYHEPLVRGGTYLGSFDSLDSWHHTIEAFGGFDSAEFNISAPEMELWDWFENGIGRHIMAIDDGGETIWEGFVNEIAISVGGYAVTKGPLLNIGNAVAINFSTFDFGFTPPIPGVRKFIDAVPHEESQRRYGIVYKLLSAVGISDANALQLLETYLEENHEPENSASFSFSDTETSLTVYCRGYFHWLQYPYNNVSPGFTNIGDKIRDILSNDPNGIISTDFSNVAPNTAVVPFWEISEQEAKEAIRGYVIQGDASNQRYIFGIYEERKAHYGPVPDFISYKFKLRDASRQVFDLSDNLVPPWRIRPGRWIQFTDFMLGSIPSITRLREDPRNLFIETVEFTAPNILNLSGGKVTKFEQKLAKLGLSGVAA